MKKFFFEVDKKQLEKATEPKGRLAGTAEEKAALRQSCTK